MRGKAFWGFIVLFAAYHLSEVVGQNPVIILGCFIFFFIVAQLVAKALGEKGLSAFGLQKHEHASSQLFKGYIFGCLFYGGSFFVSVMQGKISFKGAFSFQQLLLPLFGIIVITFFSSASEDVLTRGYIFRMLPKNWSLGLTISLSSFIYVINHVWRIGEGYTQWLLLLLMGLTFAIPLAVTRSLWFTIGCHWGWNTVSLFKSHISDMSDLKIIDHTTDWTYIFTMTIFLVFVILYSKLALKRPTDLDIHLEKKDLDF